LCGGLIHRNMAWGAVLEQLKQARLDRIADRHAVEPHHQSVWHAIHVSVEFLRPDEKQRFLELAVFLPDETTPEAAIATLWAHTGRLDEWKTRELLVSLAERSLVQLVSKAEDGVEPPRPQVALHDLVYDYVGRVAPVTPTTHDRLLTAYRARCTEGWPSGPNDGYFFTHLFHHLAESGRGDERTKLLLDLPWLEAKAEAGYVFDLAMDFTGAGERLPADQPARRHLRLIEQALRSDLHFLARHPATLFQCLWNRCWWYDCPEAAAHYDPPPGGWPAAGPPWARPAPERLAPVLESWRADKERRAPSFRWARSLRPPAFPLGGAELACFRGHTHWVSSVAFSPDGRRLVSGSHDNAVRVWDDQTGAELACLRAHTEAVRSVGFSPDGRRLVSGSHDKTVRVWDYDAPLFCAELACLRGHTAGVHSVAFSPDGRRLVSGSNDQTVRVWDAQTGAELACLRGHTDTVGSVAFSPDGRRLVSRSSDQTVRVWDAGSGARLEVLQGSDDVKAIAAGGDRLPWRAAARGMETVIEPAAGGNPVAWFPAALSHITTHASGRRWAGSADKGFCIIELEGEPDAPQRDTTR
jgi:WD40 repeat protein